jgi:hypothetical protein
MLSPQGDVSVPNPDSVGGLMSFQKDLVVIIGFWPPESVVRSGSFMEIHPE